MHPDRFVDLALRRAMVSSVFLFLFFGERKQLNDLRPDRNEEKLFRNHPLRMGGLIGERKDINSIKLGLAGSHISQTNHGYSRKEDGTFYNY